MALSSDIENLVGEFTEAQHGKHFSYRMTTNEWALSHGYTHELDFVNGQRRFASVRQTRVKVVLRVFDNEPVVETWAIKNHNIFPKE